MVVVNGVRYRPEHAPQKSDDRADEKPAEHKMRTPRTRAARSK